MRNTIGGATERTASPEDARRLARHTAPRLGEHDLAHLDAYRAAARLVVDGAQTAAYNPDMAARDRRESGWDIRVVFIERRQLWWCKCDVRSPV